MTKSPGPCYVVTIHHKDTEITELVRRVRRAHAKKVGRSNVPRATLAARSSLEGDNHVRRYQKLVASRTAVEDPDIVGPVVADVGSQ